MTRTFAFALAVALLCGAGTLFGQSPELVSVRLSQPPPNQLRVADLWKVYLTNTSGRPVKVYLHGTAEESSIPDGIIADATTKIIEIPNGQTVVTGTMVQPVKIAEYNPKYRDALLRTGTVPTGDYQICCEVISAETDQILGKDCKFTTVNRLSQPILIAPPDESEVPMDYPVFTWMSSVPPGPGQRILYQVRIHEMFATQTPQDAVSRNPAFLDVRDLSRTILQYPVSARKFTVGQKYAWVVSAYEESGSSIINLGVSEVWTFVFRPFRGDTTPPDRPKPPSVAAELTDVCPGENWDFEIGSLACWTVEGEAFKNDPVKDDHPVLGSLGQNGRYWVTSYGVLTGDEALGRMQSQEFRIQTSMIGFVVGGSLSPDAAVELYVERTAKDTFKLPVRKLPGLPGEFYLAYSTGLPSARGTASERLVPVEWDVVRFINRASYLVVKDSSKMAHVNVDNFRFFDREKLDSIKLPVLVMAAGERHSLVATPEEKSPLKLAKELGISAADLKAGNKGLFTDATINQVATGIKAKKSWASSYVASKQDGQSDGGQVDYDVTDMKQSDGAGTYMKGFPLAALDPKNIVWGWGDNLRYAITKAYPSVVSEPKKLSKVSNVLALAAGMDMSFAVEKGGVVKGWGLNDYWQLGVNDRVTKGEPTSLPGLTGVIDVAAGSRHAMALTSKGDVYVWGYNRTFENGFFGGKINVTTGQLDGIDNPPTPRKHPMLKGIRAIACGHSHSLALTMSGVVAGWGVNGNGQAGFDDDFPFVPIPLPIAIDLGGSPGIKRVKSVIDIAAGDAHSMALTNTGEVFVWGSNASGQLGDGTTTDRHVPKKVEALKNIRAIAAGGSFCLALDSSGVVWAWGNNILGQCGDGTRLGRLTPVKVSRVDAVQGIVAGGAHAMAVRADGSLWTWGQNGLGQMGEGPVIDLVPVPADPPIGPLRVERLAMP